MKSNPNTFLIAVTLLILAAIGLFIGKPGREPGAAQGALAAEARSLTVIAEGSVKAKPDMARAVIAVESEAGNASAAQESNVRKVAAVIDRLRSLGVAKGDIHTLRTDIYSVSVGQGGAAPAFRASSLLDVTISDPDDTGGVLDGALAAGATKILGAGFGLKDDTALRPQAVALAVKKARAKADQLAAAAKVAIKGIKSISVEEPPPSPLPTAEALRTGAGAPAIPGEAVVRVTVTVTYSF